MTQPVHIAGVGMTPFAKPGAHAPYPEMAAQAVASGAADCVLALGFEHMNPGALGNVFTDRPSPFDPFDAATAELVDRADIPQALRYFGGAGLAHTCVVTLYERV